MGKYIILGGEIRICSEELKSMKIEIESKQDEMHKRLLSYPKIEDLYYLLFLSLSLGL
jgi:hypothetical protein